MGYLATFWQILTRCLKQMQMHINFSRARNYYRAFLWQATASTRSETTTVVCPYLGILGGASIDPIDPCPRTVYPRFLSDPRPEKVAVKAPKPLGKQEAGDLEDLG